MDKKATRILQVNLGDKHAHYKAKIEAIGLALEKQGYNVRDPKKPANISAAAVIRLLIDAQEPFNIS